MPKLYRPHVPLSVRCQVAERAIMRGMPAAAFEHVLAHTPERPFGARLAALLQVLAGTLGCDVAELRLDHDPALGARPKYRRGLGKKTYYIPDANDPGHLFYRPHGPEHAGSHLIKTNVRGDHGQHPDRVLIKKARQLESHRAKKKGRLSTLRKIANRATSGSGTDSRPQKRKWAKRPFGKRREP